MLNIKAEEFVKKLDHDDFKATDDWLSCWTLISCVHLLPSGGSSFASQVVMVVYVCTLCASPHLLDRN